VVQSSEEFPAICGGSGGGTSHGGHLPKVDDRHFSLVAELLVDGEIIPFLGAGANLSDRPDEATWEPGRFPPSGSELALTLAERSRYPDSDDPDLLRVSQYVDAILGEGQLYRYLHTVFDSDYPPSSVHRLLARLPGFLRDRSRPQLVVLTTNYDDLVERALKDAGETFDVVWYEAKRGPQQGLFFHRSPEGEVVPIERPNKYTGLAPAERPVVLKLHGAIDRGDSKRDSYVVTEDSYIDYLAGRDVGEQIPFSLRERMADSHYLFLGYSMHDWNLRVILNRIWGAQQLDLKSWAVQREPASAGAREVEEALWRDRGDVDLLYVPLKSYVEGLERGLAMP
jgi:SIR2-like domain